VNDLGSDFSLKSSLTERVKDEKERKNIKSGKKDELSTMFEEHLMGRYQF